MTHPAADDHPLANTLYRRWLETSQHQPDSIALRDQRTGQAFTWETLRSLAACHPAPARLRRDLPLAPIAVGGVEFILNVLAAWREGLVILPLEPGTRPPPAWLDPALDLPHLPRDCAIVKMTSGSTGAPRGIAFTCAQLTADADQLVPLMGLSRLVPNLGVISLAHSYGFSNLVTPLILHAVPLVLAESALPHGLRLLLGSGQISSWALPAVPALWKTWLAAGIFEHAGGQDGFRFGISAGAPLPLELERQAWEKCGIRIHNFLGASECGGIAYDASPEPRSDAALAGRVIPGVEAALSAEGTLQVRGPAVGETYWPQAGPDLRQGLYTSTDLASLRENGELRILGRAGDLINIAGRKLTPPEVENALKTHPAVKECLVFGIRSRDSARQQEIAVCVRTSVPEAELRAFLHALLPSWKIPRHWWLTDDLRPDARGKLSRDLWRKRFLHANPQPTV